MRVLAQFLFNILRWFFRMELEMRVGDVTVVGLTPGTVVLDDICMDVPHGTTVTVPADKATNSKDLWRAISQRKVFRINAVSTPSLPAGREAEYQERARLAEQEAQRLKIEIEALQKARTEDRQAQRQLLSEVQNIKEQSSQLSEIIGILKNVQLSSSGPMVTTVAARPRSDVVEVDAPSFIPSQIKREGDDTRISVTTETTENSGVQDASEALRRFRQGSKS